MFLKSTGFKKLIKEAYSGPGLRMGNDGEGIYLSGGYWTIWVKVGKIPKKELAAIIELTGEIPAAGEHFIATKDGNQYELEYRELCDIMDNARNCETYLDTTSLSYHTCFGNVARILQEPHSKKTYTINERFIDMVDNTVVEYNDDESPAEGLLIGEKTGIFWFNNIMAIRVMCRDDESVKHILEHLERIVIAKDEWKS